MYNEKAGNSLPFLIEFIVRAPRFRWISEYPVLDKPPERAQKARPEDKHCYNHTDYRKSFPPGFDCGKLCWENVPSYKCINKIVYCHSLPDPLTEKICKKLDNI